MWHLWMKGSEFPRLPGLMLQSNSINLDVKSTGIEMKRHRNLFPVQSGEVDGGWAGGWGAGRTLRLCAQLHGDGLGG